MKNKKIILTIVVAITLVIIAVVAITANKSQDKTVTGTDAITYGNE